MISEKRLIEIASSAKRMAERVVAKGAKKSAINNLSLVLAAHPSKSRANLVHLQEFLRHQVSRGERFTWARILLREMDRYFSGPYEEMEYLLGYLAWEVAYLEREATHVRETGKQA